MIDGSIFEFCSNTDQSAATIGLGFFDRLAGSSGRVFFYLVTCYNI